MDRFDFLKSELRTDFVLASSVDTGEMPHYAAFLSWPSLFANVPV